MTHRPFAGDSDFRAMPRLAQEIWRDDPSRGTQTALVASRGDAAYPVPTLLYESIGFRQVAGHLPYVRDR